MFNEDSESYMNNSLFHFLFPKNVESYIEEDSIISSKFEDNPLNNLNSNRNENLEDIDIEEKNNYSKVTIKKNKIGRKRKNETEICTGHNKYCSDNIIRKIQIHFISFIIKFINLVLLELGYIDEFCNINYRFKEKVNKRNIAKLKRSNIGYILCQKISPKYKKNEDKNKIIYEKLKNIPVLRNIFSYNYTDFFKDFYYNKENNLNLNKFGLNINLKHKYGDSIKMYNDLKEENNKDPEYIKRLEECVNIFY